MTNNNPSQQKELLGKIIRKLYHDGVNIFGPLREMVIIKLNPQIRDYLMVNISYYLTLLKNLKFYYLITHNPNFFEEDKFRVSDTLKKALLDLKCYNPPDLNIILDTELKCSEEIFYMVIFNLLNNACRFGNKVCIEVKAHKLIIHNTSVFPLPDEINSIFNLPVSHDKFGTIGAGVGLHIVKTGATLLNINIEEELKKDSDSIKVLVDYSNLVVV